MTKMSQTCLSFLGLENDKTESDMLFFSGLRE